MRSRIPEPRHDVDRPGETSRGQDLGPDHPDGEIRIREKAREDVRPLRADLAGIALRAAKQERRFPVRAPGRRRQVGVEVLETARGEIAAARRVRGPPHPYRTPPAEDAVREAG